MLRHVARVLEHYYVAALRIPKPRQSFDAVERHLGAEHQLVDEQKIADLGVFSMLPLGILTPDQGTFCPTNRSTDTRKIFAHSPRKSVPALRLRSRSVGLC